MGSLVKSQDLDLTYSTLFEGFEQQCKVTPNKEAVVVYREDEEPTRMTYSELKQITENMATCLLRAYPDLRRGECVAVVGSNRIELLLCNVMCARIGLTTVFPPCGVQGVETIEYALKIANCKALFYEHHCIRNEDIVRLLSDNSSFRSVVVYGEQGETPPGVTAWKILFGKEGPSSPSLPEPGGVDDDFIATFTSGSTGKPKAVRHSVGAFLHRGSACKKYIGMDSNTKFFSDRPIAYSAGCGIFWACVFLCGSTYVTLDSKQSVKDADVQAVFSLIKNENITIMFSFGYMLHDIMNSREFPKDHFDSLQVAVTGGQVINADTVRQIRARFPGLKLINLYGSSEGGVMAFSEDNAEDGYMTIVDELEAKVVNAEGNIVPLGEPGKLIIRGQGFFKGYWKIEGFDTGKDMDGWFETGDSAIMKDKRRIKILGRMSDAIKKAGVIVFPQTVEGILRKHPKVKDVQVIGVPDPRLYEDICAIIVRLDPTLTEEELRQWSTERFAADPTGLSLAPR